MPQNPPAFQDAIATLHEAYETFGPAELGRRADPPLALSTVRSLKERGFRPKGVRGVERLVAAAEALKAELAAR